MSWVAFGWLSGFMLLLGGYYVMRFIVRKRKTGYGHPQSLFIAGLTGFGIAFGASVAGLLSRAAELALAFTGAAFATVFLFAVVDDLRRNGM